MLELYQAACYATPTMLIIWGAGTLGRLVGAQWDGDVAGYTKTTRSHDLLQEMEITPYIGSPIDAMTQSDHLLLALPGHQRQMEAIKRLAESNIVPKRSVLISSTGYYGGVSGVVDENSSAGTSPRAQAIAQMETAFWAWTGARGVILRPGGIYSAERGPFTVFKRRGTLPEKPMNRTLALIHYEDVATAAVNALTHPDPEPIYLAVTHPTPTRGEFYRAAVEQLGWEMGVVVEGAADIVTYDTTRLQRDLLPTPAHPDWRTIFT